MVPERVTAETYTLSLHRMQKAIPWILDPKLKFPEENTGESFMTLDFVKKMYCIESNTRRTGNKNKRQFELTF